MNGLPNNLIHKNERKYFIIAVLFSIITYIGLIFSIIGIIYLGLILAVSMLLHALMLGYIRTNGVRLNPEQFPKVYDKVKELCAKMEMKFVPDVYVLESSGTLNAFATRFFGRNMVVLFSPVFELIEEGAEDELSFVIAHELAHIKRRHISKQLLVLPAM
jgi:Zn-dependent protease with chaperone function